FFVVDAESNHSGVVMNWKNQIGRRGPPAQAIFPISSQLAIERLNRFAFFGGECRIDQIVSANLGGVPIEFHVVLPMTTRGDVGIQAGSPRANLLEQMPADNLSRLFICFEGEYQGGIN